MSSLPPPVLDPDASATAPSAADGLFARLLPALIDRQAGLIAVKAMPSGTYLQLNDAMARWLGRPAAEIVGRTDVDLLDAALLATMRAAEQTALAQAGPLASEHRFERGGARQDYVVWRIAEPAGDDGRRLLASVWIDQSAQRQRDAQLRAALEQLEQEQRSNEQLRREIQDQALRDFATGLYTRAHFDDQLKREVDLSTREHREFALVSIALDPLSERAAALGEPAASRIFEALGRLLRGNTRAMDASCRLDGTRFAVLLSGVGLATAHARMEGLRRQCATQIVVLNGQELGFSVSMGVASFPHTAHSQEALMVACDTALEEAQRRGGNHVTLASIRFEPT